MIDDRASLAGPELAALEAIVATQRTLEDVVRWSLALDPPKVIAAVVVQDEYTHDVVLPYEGTLHLVYDTT